MLATKDLLVDIAILADPKRNLSDVFYAHKRLCKRLLTVN